MSHRGFRVAAAASAASLAVLTLAAAAPALAGPAQAKSGQAQAGQAQAGQARAVQVTAPAGGSREVTLVTGDVVAVSTLPGGRQTASVVRAHPQGPGGQFRMFTLGGDLYVVPQSAVPYLDSTLSPGLFDVTQLARQKHGASLAVRLRLRNSSGPAAIPGITVTHRSGLTVTGRLTAASARRFGTALARQAERDHGVPVHTVPVHTVPVHAAGLFADVAWLGLAAVPPRAQPALFPMYTLTLNGITPAGGRDNGDLVVVYNADDLRKYAGQAVFANGRAKISVPAGHYAAICYFFNFTTGAVSEVTVPQFTVSGVGSVTVDGRLATSQVSVSTPRPATPVVSEVTVARADRRGLTGSYTFLGSGPTPFSVEPVTRPVPVGQLYYYVYSRQFSPAGVRPGYSYDVEFPSNGVIPVAQHYVVPPSGLATIQSAYPATHANQVALETRFAILPWQFFLFALDVPVATPMQRTEYYTASPGMAWHGVYYAVFQPATFALLGELDSSWAAYQRGESLSATWGGQPEHPRLLQDNLSPGQVICAACVAGRTLRLLAFPFSDNSPGHYGFPDGSVTGLSESASFDIYADGVRVAAGKGLLEKKVALPAGTNDVRIDYTTARSSSDFTLSTSAVTTWTFRPNAPTGTLPAGWYCDFHHSTACRVVPLMTADYALPLNLLGRLAPGAATGRVSVGHLAGASDVAVTSLSVRVSFDGGASWHPATVASQGSGQYAVSFTVPPAASTDGFGALRLRAADAYGGTLTQTIQHAFAVAGS